MCLGIGLNCGGCPPALPAPPPCLPPCPACAIWLSLHADPRAPAPARLRRYGYKKAKKTDDKYEKKEEKDSYDSYESSGEQAPAGQRARPAAVGDSLGRGATGCLTTSQLEAQLRQPSACSRPQHHSTHLSCWPCADPVLTTSGVCPGALQRPARSPPAPPPPW
jgi:hypothetical protein